MSRRVDKERRKRKEMEDKWNEEEKEDMALERVSFCKAHLEDDDSYERCPSTFHSFTSKKCCLHLARGFPDGKLQISSKTISSNELSSNERSSKQMILET